MDDADYAWRTPKAKRLKQQWHEDRDKLYQMLANSENVAEFELPWDPSNREDSHDLYKNPPLKQPKQEDPLARYHRTPTGPSGEYEDTRTYSHATGKFEGRNRMKITKRQLRRIIAEEREKLIQEGWLDRFKSKAFGTATKAQAKLKGKDADSSGLAQLDFTVKARKRLAKTLEKMAAEMDNDIKKMGFAEDGPGYEQLKEITEILRDAAADMENVADLVRAKKKSGF